MVAYEGHGVGTGGLQRHSIGEDYPYTIIGVQSGPEGPLQWQAMDTRSGSKGLKRRTYLEAQQDVTSAKIRNMMHS